MIVTLSVAVTAGVMSQPPQAFASPGAGMATSPVAGTAVVPQDDGPPGAEGQKPGAAPIFVPNDTINRTVLGAPASPGPWTGDSSQGLPGDQPVDPSRQIKKPGLGAQDFYPLERRALGDRLEMLVNLANGNLIVRATDMTVPGTGISLGVSHFYNNMADNRGSFGRKWTMSTGRDVGLDVRDPNRLILQGPSGYRQDYVRSGTSYRSPSGANARMTRTASGYRLTFNESKEKWNFDNNGFLITQVDRNDNTITFNYNPNGTLASVRDSREAVTTFDHDQAGRVTTITDPTGYEYGGYSYDDQGRHTGFTTPDGRRVEFGYDDAGNLATITDPNGNEYRMGYDAQRRITTVDEPRETGVFQNDRAVTRYQHVSNTETRGTAPNGGTSIYTFDSEGRQTKAKDPLGREQSKTWTANSDVNTTTTIGGNVSTSSYDPANRLIGTALPTGARNAVGYSDGANPFAPTSMTDSEGRQTSMTYDADGNPLSIKNAATGQGIDRTYNDDGTVKDSTDGKGQKTTYTYDDQGRLTQVTSPGPRESVTYEYDARSRLTAVTDGNGVTLEYAYDASDRVVQLAERQGGLTGGLFGPRVIQRTDYDPNGNRVANFHASTTKRMTYSPRNQVLTDVRQGQAPESVAYTYDATNNLASLRDGGGTTSYRYNQANDLTELTDLAGGVSRYTYDGDGNPAIINKPNRTQTLFGYDDSDRLTQMSHQAAGFNFSITEYNYSGSRGDTELVQSEKDLVAGDTFYTYDGAGQLTRAQNSFADDRFSYDRAGNMTRNGPAAQQFNASNTLTNSAAAAIAADPQGNLTEWAGGRAGMTYSPTNQQLSKSTPQTSFQTSYDTADNTQPNRFDERLPTGAAFTYDIAQTALGVTGVTRAAQGRYAISRDPSGAPIMQRNPDGSVHYFEADRQGSITGHTNGQGTRTATFRYKPYGTYSVVRGADSSNNDNFLGFQSGLFLRGQDNVQFGHRWYDSRLGKFTQPDPIGTPGSSGSGQDSQSGIGGPYSTEMNAYNFASNNPANFSDPSGLAPCESRGKRGFSYPTIGGVQTCATGLTEPEKRCGRAVGKSIIPGVFAAAGGAANATRDGKTSFRSAFKGGLLGYAVGSIGTCIQGGIAGG